MNIMKIMKIIQTMNKILMIGVVNQVKANKIHNKINK